MTGWARVFEVMAWLGAPARMMTLGIVGLLASFAIGAAGQEPVADPVIAADSALRPMIQALTAQSLEEGRERAACLLGYLTPDSIVITAGIEGQYVSRSATGTQFRCPDGITVGTWHSHPSGNCAPSGSDRVDAERQVDRAGSVFRILAISIAPGETCAWWFSEARQQFELLGTDW
jgi:hypothetical protein